MFWLAASMIVVLALAGTGLLIFGPAQHDEAPPTTTELRRHWQASVR